MEYVYMYMHPDKGYVYIGRTNNLRSRIYSHNNSKTDNIDRKYEPLLNECTIYYAKLPNKALSVAMEAYLINEKKPLLNKMLKYEESWVANVKMEFPKWEIFPSNSLESVEDIAIIDDCFQNLMQSKKFQKLSTNAKVLCLYMKMESILQSEEKTMNDNCFRFPQKMLEEKYGLYKNFAQFRRDRAHLIENGFLEIARSGKATRTENVYRFLI